jgi:hypothetical protein
VQQIQQFQQMLQGGSSNQNNQGSQSFRGRRGQQGMQGFQGQGQQAIQGLQGVQGRRGQGNQQVQNFQPWQLWQPQGLRGNVRGGQGNQQHNHSHWFVQLGGGPAPFTIGWYEHHPHAWHWHHDHDNDAWKVVTAAGVLGWLGWGQPVQSYVVYDPVPRHVELFDVNAAGPWMTLGVYSLLTGPSESGTRILQLAINQQGYLRGSYYDMVTDETYNVRGRVDRASQFAQWHIDTNRQLTFYTPLSQLTQSQGFVNVRLQGGTQQWQLLRMDYGNN